MEEEQLQQPINVFSVYICYGCGTVVERNKAHDTLTCFDILRRRIIVANGTIFDQEAAKMVLMEQLK